MILFWILMFAWFVFLPWLVSTMACDLLGGVRDWRLRFMIFCAIAWGWWETWQAPKEPVVAAARQQAAPAIYRAPGN